MLLAPVVVTSQTFQPPNSQPYPVAVQTGPVSNQTPPNYGINVQQQTQVSHPMPMPMPMPPQNSNASMPPSYDQISSTQNYHQQPPFNPSYKQ